MQPEQDLHQAVRNQFVQREQFLVGGCDGIGVARIGGAEAGGFARGCVEERLAGKRRPIGV